MSASTGSSVIYTVNAREEVHPLLLNVTAICIIVHWSRSPLFALPVYGLIRLILSIVVPVLLIRNEGKANEEASKRLKLL